ncbi:unnamed protein product [Strongylus vulgaris]|uniref:Uncharacterized protein n=1 Tax=Strongylus vulgaris TaxID=40348 RepID=A0A3P7I3E5_STRVU|nr:unnamed protein product [Strongylus vulgaris]
MSSYVYLGRSMNMFSANDLKAELNRERSAAWTAFGLLKEATDNGLRASSPPVLANLSSLLPAFCAAEKWPDTVVTSKALRTIQIALQRCLLKYNRCTQYLVGVSSSRFSKIRSSYIIRRTDDRWTKNSGVDPSRSKTSSRDHSDGLTCSLHGWTAKFSAGNE